jgi:hypothetical protein
MDAAELQKKIYTLVETNMGKKKMKAGDIKKAMVAEGASEEEVKAAIRELVDGGRLVYSYFGGSFIEVPHTEGSANPQQ